MREKENYYSGSNQKKEARRNDIEKFSMFH
jgi:hypothetical protein